MTKKLPPCDCLNYCGDDPWIVQGKARSCAHKIARDAESARAAARLVKLSEKKLQIFELYSSGRACERDAEFTLLAIEYFELLFEENPT